MKKFKKFLLVFFISFIVLFIGLIVALRIAYPPEKLKGILITKMSEFLHREIEIKKVSIGFRGLEVGDLKISERPSFKEGVFVESKQFLIMPDLFAILRKQISISKITLKSPRISIIRNKDNSFNFSDLIPTASTEPVKKTAEQQKKKPVSVAETMPIGFIVSRFALTDGNVKFVDKSPQAMSAELKNINVNLSGISLVTSFSVDLSVDAVFKNMEGSFSFGGIVNLAQQSLKINQAMVTVDGAGLKVSGDVKKFMKPETLDFNVNVKDEKLFVEKFVKLAEKIAPFPKGFSISGEPKIDVNVSGNMNKIQVKGSVDAKGVETKFEDLFSKPKDMETLLTADLVFENNDVLKINNISAVLNTIKTSLQGKVSGISKNRILFDLKIVLDKFNLKAISPIVPMAKDFGISGFIEDETIISGDLKTIAVTGKAKLQDFQSVQKDMTAKISGTEVGYSVNITDSKKMNITFNVDGDTIDIKMPEQPKQQAKTPVKSKENVTEAKPVQTVSAPQQTQSAVGSQPGQSKSTAKSGVPKDIFLSGDLKLKKFVFEKFIISDCSAKVDLKNAMLNIKPFSMKMCNGNISGSIFADLTDLEPSRLKFDFATDVKNYDIHELLLETGKDFKAQVWGTAEGKVRISGTGSNMTGLNGNGSLSVKNMKINNVKILDRLAAAAGMPQLKETSFGLVNGGFNIINGSMNLTDTKTINGDKLDAYLSGNVNLVNQTQDIKGDIKFTQEYSGGSLAKYTADNEGRVTVPFYVKGSFEDPKVNLDWNKIAKTAAKKEAQRVLIKEGEKLLKGLFNR